LLSVAAVAAAGVLREGDATGLCGNSTSYAGYFDIDPSTNKHYFYWLYESRSSPSTDPLVIWMTGGPGCSGELAMLTENGPCHVIDKGAATVYNPYSWNNNANMLFIDQPVQVGFSYGDESGDDHNEAQVGRDMVAFIQALLKAHPEYQNRPLFITGESYGGHYVPATAGAIYDANAAGEGLYMNLQGIAVGNGLTDPLVQYQWYAEQAYNWSIAVQGKPVISLETYESMNAAWPQCQSMIAACQSDTNACPDAQSYCNQVMLGPYEQTGRNVYDITKPCEVPGLCYDFSPETTWLNNATVQSTIGVNKEWATCNFEVNGDFSKDWMKDQQGNIPKLLANGTRVLIYAGDYDFICNWIGNKHWTISFDWAGHDAFAAAPDRNWNPSSYGPSSKYTGVARSYGGLTFLQVHAAGHMVPRDQPVVSLGMIEDFLAGKPF
jgi:cathepsin A (carboxypeptidase C)